MLKGLDLQGNFQPLTSVTQLQVLSLKRNRLSGPISNISNLTALKLFFLSYNEFSGEFPTSVRLFSNYNVSICLTTTYRARFWWQSTTWHILTLRLEENRFFSKVWISWIYRTSMSLETTSSVKYQKLFPCSLCPPLTEMWFFVDLPCQHVRTSWATQQNLDPMVQSHRRWFLAKIQQ